MNSFIKQNYPKELRKLTKEKQDDMIWLVNDRAKLIANDWDIFEPYLVHPTDTFEELLEFERVLQELCIKLDKKEIIKYNNRINDILRVLQ